MGKKNIENNNLDNVIILQAGCSNKNGSLTIDPEISNVGAILEESKKGIEVKLLTLENLIGDYDIKSGILKMNCEGCEYDAILWSSVEVLKKFSHILIAYHNGYQDLKKKLEDSNFKIQVIQHPQYQEQGWIFAHLSED